MYCPDCGEKCPEHYKFCGVCGRPLPVSENVTEPASSANVSTPAAVADIPVKTSEAPVTAPEIQSISAPVSAEPKGRIWPPMAIMAGLTAVGLVLFFLIS